MVTMDRNVSSIPSPPVQKLNYIKYAEKVVSVYLRGCFSKEGWFTVV